MLCRQLRKLEAVLKPGSVDFESDGFSFLENAAHEMAKLSPMIRRGLHREREDWDRGLGRDHLEYYASIPVRGGLWRH